MSESNKTINDGFAYIYDDGEDTVEDLLMKNANLLAQLTAAQAEVGSLRQQAEILQRHYSNALETLEEFRQLYAAAQAEVERLQAKNVELSGALGVVMDQVDYRAGNCRINEMVGAVLPVEVIQIARKALKGGAQ